jgi:hypothetical protein
MKIKITNDDRRKPAAVKTRVAGNQECDFYICACESLRAQCEQYAEHQAISARQFLFETI